jgi:hypothetical protein
MSAKTAVGQQPTPASAGRNMTAANAACYKLWKRCQAQVSKGTVSRGRWPLQNVAAIHARQTWRQHLHTDAIYTQLQSRQPL